MLFFETYYLIGLEKHFGIEFDRESMVRMKQMKFKGVAQPTIMRKKNTSQQESNGTDNAGADGAGADGAGADGESPLQFPYPYESGLTSEELAERKAKEVQSVDQIVIEFDDRCYCRTLYIPSFTPSPR